MVVIAVIYAISNPTKLAGGAVKSTRKVIFMNTKVVKAGSGHRAKNQRERERRSNEFETTRISERVNLLQRIDSFMRSHEEREQDKSLRIKKVKMSDLPDPMRFGQRSGFAHVTSGSGGAGALKTMNDQRCRNLKS